MRSLICEIVNKLIEFYQQRKGIFSEVDSLLEYQCPKGVERGSREHANFYFFLIYNDHGTKSRSLYEKFKRAYEENPHLFSHNHLDYNEKLKENLKRVIFNLGVRYPNQSFISWVENARRLAELFDGDALKLFRSTTDAVSLYRKIKSFRGYGPKTTGLLLRVIAGIPFNSNLQNLEEVLMPVDIHDVRIAIQCNVFRPRDVSHKNREDLYRNPRHIRSVQKLWKEAAIATGLKWEELDRALWLLGSKGCTSKKCNLCPIKAYCSKGKRYAPELPNLFANQTL